MNGSYSGRILACVNHGNISAKTSAAGICGSSGSGILIDSCVNYGNIRTVQATSNVYAGGIATQLTANRSNPTARNWQEIRVFVFDKEGVWEYQPAAHSLALAKEGDHRNLIAGTKEFTQEFVLEAPVSILFVVDMTNLPDEDQAKVMACVDTGIACENLNLACVSEGIATVPRATMDIRAISQLLGLSPRQLPIMNNPIGYPK